MQAQGYVWKHRAFKLLQQNKESAEAQRFLRLSIGYSTLDGETKLLLTICREFEAVLAGNSCSTHALRNLGQLYWAQRQEADVEETRKALRVYERAMALDPKYLFALLLEFGIFLVFNLECLCSYELHVRVLTRV